MTPNNHDDTDRVERCAPRRRQPVRNAASLSPGVDETTYVYTDADLDAITRELYNYVRHCSDVSDRTAMEISDAARNLHRMGVTNGPDTNTKNNDGDKQ